MLGHAANNVIDKREADIQIKWVLPSAIITAAKMVLEVILNSFKERRPVRQPSLVKVSQFKQAISNPLS